MQQLASLSLSLLRGVGPRTTDALAQAGLHTVWDLLLTLPIRYENRSYITSLAQAQPGVAALFDGEIVKSWQQFAKRRMLCVKVSDGTSELTLRWFNFNMHQQKRLQPGVRARIYGAPVLWQKHFEIIHPELELYSDGNPPSLSETLYSVYRSILGVSQNKIRSLQSQALALLESNFHSSALDRLFPSNLPGIKQSLLQLHKMPAVEYDHFTTGEHPAAKRLIMEELLAQLWYLRSQRRQDSERKAAPIPFCTQTNAALLQQFGYDLTAGQQVAASEIQSDMERDTPMRRLLQGDVGAGKTAVAAVATLQVAAHGLQSAWLAPTTVLAEQHAATLQKWFAPLGIEVACFTASLKSSARKQILEALRTGQLLVVVGTHAIFQETVLYKNLSFLVIDEQHRFGARQRGALHLKGCNPHSLSMTATPIPRTLMQSWFAGIASSQLKEKPKCRLPIHTSVISSDAREQLLSRVHKICQQGGRVYWVCSLIESNAANDAHAAEDVFVEMKQLFSDVKIGLIHGKMRDTEKHSVMGDFSSGAVQILVATTVIEVGVDVPEATIIVIDNPERLGLTQLHQLRGRVGRSATQSYCVLLAANNLSETASARLALLRESNDGFYLAEQDLRWRGPGQLLGAQQAGYFSFQVANLLRDASLLPEVNLICERLLQHPAEDFEELLAAWLPAQGTCLS